MQVAATVETGRSDWFIDKPKVKEWLKFVSMESGELSVMMVGMTVMPQSLADSWDTFKVMVCTEVSM